MVKLAAELRRPRIPFDSASRRIRFSFFFYFQSRYINQIITRCFPHVVNLACKAVLSAITKTDFTMTGNEDGNLFEDLDKDPVATLRKLVNAVRNSCFLIPIYS